jgi:mannose-6-phosphate isomerase-like protein (cupin superfamily)
LIGQVYHAVMRVIAPMLFALILINVACSSNSQSGAINANTNEWQPIQSVPGALRRYLVGDASKPGPYKYQLKIPAGARLAAHQHSVDVHVKVVSGSMFIIIGEPLESSRAQHFTTGNVFVVPAHTWHDEWWDEESVLEAEGVGPMETVYKSVGFSPRMSQMNTDCYPYLSVKSVDNPDPTGQMS